MEYPRLVRSLRSNRSWHRRAGIALALFLFIVSLTGILLAWKKEVDIIQPPTTKGVSPGLVDWLPIDSLSRAARIAFDLHRPDLAGNPVDRIDIRPGKGIAKVLFEKGWWEVQIDGHTGEALSVSRRHSDWIEQLHDGSIVSDNFKLIMMNLLGVGLIFMLASGIWLYWGPRRIRRLRKGK